jgi:glycosyltransferase involved in cell wall biosynthesis
MSSLYPASQIAYILPTHGHFDYARRCLESLLDSSNARASVAVVVVDDASPDWSDDWCTEDLPFGSKVIRYRFDKQGGLTRSWNAGFLLTLDKLSPDYVVAGNSDILVPRDWQNSMIGALKTCMFTGPTTNRPGATIDNLQDIRNWYPDYVESDSFGQIQAVRDILESKYGSNVERPSPINGFFMCGQSQTWLDYAHDAHNVFPPSIDTMPSGRPNPTPLMTGQEDWLNAKVKASSKWNGVALGSFVFHYRSVSRGEKYAKQTGFFRRAEPCPTL